MRDAWAYWIVGGILLMMAELAIGAFFIFWFGLGAIVVGLLMWLFPSLGLTPQILIWIVASLTLVTLWLKVFKQSFFKTKIGTAQDGVVGSIGLVTREIKPFQKGAVQFQKPIMGDDKWEALADNEIAVGERVELVDVEGW
jgi:membrane protein implicated in regulation of membrane protease activity